MSDALWEGLREGCGTCRFGDRHEWGTAEKPVVSVTCRRFPPTMVQNVERNQFDTLSYEIVEARPNMGEAEWCGEYKRKTA